MGLGVAILLASCFASEIKSYADENLSKRELKKNLQMNTADFIFLMKNLEMKLYRGKKKEKSMKKIFIIKE